MNALDKIWYALRAAKDSGLGYAFWYGILAFALWIVFYVALRKFRSTEKFRRIGQNAPK